MRKNWQAVLTAVLAVLCVGIGGAMAYEKLTGDCCATGSACCKPGAPCCHPKLD